MLIRPPHEIHQRPRKQTVVNNAIDLRIDQGVEEDSCAAERVVVVTGERKFGDGYEYLGRRGILETGVGCRAAGFIAEDGVETFDATAGVGGCGLLVDRGVAGAPYLLSRMVRID